MRVSRVVALALVVGTFFVTQEILTELANGKPVSVINDIEVVFLFWAAWACLTPAVLAVVRRWPLDVKPTYGTALAHFSAAILLSAAQCAITRSVRVLIVYARGGVDMQEAVRRNASVTAFVWGIFTGMFFYAVVVMVYAALRFRALYDAERVSAAALEGELTRSKLDALRSQLRPHFLFNTLNAISVLMAEDVEKAQQMVLRLSALLRRSLDEDAQEVALHQELSFVNDYLDIQRGRFGNQLVVRLAIAPDAVNAKVPVFLLQPLLENAIEHGQADGSPTTIELTAKRSSEMLQISIVDNGPGVADVAHVHEGVGLGNTRARLRHLYGAKAGVQLRPLAANGGPPGTCVDISIPFRVAAR
jgi:two-component system, LytTR family, sensor kinase